MSLRLNEVRRPSDLLAGLLFAAIGLAAMSIANDYPMGTLRNMGPGAFPTAVGVVLCLLGTGIIIGAFFGERHPGPEFALWPLLCVLVAIAVFAALLFGAGLFLAVVVLVLVASLAGGEFDLKRGLVLGLVLATACTALFVYGLGQQLPVFGPWLSGI